MCAVEILKGGVCNEGFAGECKQSFGEVCTRRCFMGETLKKGISTKFYKKFLKNLTNLVDYFLRSAYNSAST